MVWRLGGGRRLRGKPTAMTIWVPVQPSWRTGPCELGLASVDDPRPLTPADTLMPQYRNDLALLPERWCQAPRVRVNASQTASQGELVLAGALGDNHGRRTPRAPQVRIPCFRGFLVDCVSASTSSWPSQWDRSWRISSSGAGSKPCPDWLRFTGIPQPAVDPAGRAPGAPPLAALPLVDHAVVAHP